MDAYQILVIILSIMLAILLVVSLVFMIILVKVMRQVRRITDKADHVMEGVESFSSIVKKSVGPLAVGRVMTGIFKSVKKHKSGKRGSD